MKSIFKKEDLAKFFDEINKKYELIGPTEKKGVITFDKIKSPDELVLDRQTDYPAKKYFFPTTEELMHYEKNKVDFRIRSKRRAIIMHPCDANALLITDKIFLDERPDPYYERRRKNTLIIVFKCISPGKNCFCGSMNTNETTNYDIQFIDIGDKYIVSVNSDKGREITSKSKMFVPIIRDGYIKVEFQKKLFEPNKLDREFPRSVWEEHAKKCFYCNACNFVCPTCTCFDVIDKPELSGDSGSRVRVWDGCKRPEFTEVAGGYVFRKDITKKFKHRIYHKLKYFRDRHGKNMCVGCGRCIDVCPANIDFVEIVNNLKTENDMI